MSSEPEEIETKPKTFKINVTACDQRKRLQDSSFIYLLLLYRDYNTATE